MTEWFIEFAVRYANAKQVLGGFTGAQEDLLHVHAGLLIFVVASLVLHRRMRSPLPLVVVVFLAVANELLGYAVGEPATPLEPWVDIANTLFWPLVLFALARRWRDGGRPAQRKVNS